MLMFLMCVTVILNESQIQVCSKMSEPVQRPEIPDRVLDISNPRDLMEDYAVPATRLGCILRPVGLLQCGRYRFRSLNVSRASRLAEI